MVDLFDAAPKLMMSSTPKWQDKSLWFNKVNEDYGSFAPLPEAQKKVDELIKGKKTEMEKIAVLTHWVAVTPASRWAKAKVIPFTIPR
mgnify:CR=1 FL=1